MQEPALRHRLLAILAADGVGFSRLMTTDERATVAVLDASRAVFREQIEAHGGRLVDTAGDSVLAVFDTAAGAVVAALAVQVQLAELRRDTPADRYLRFRIGIHLGDVFEKADGTVYGDGVNIAARLQALGDPDGLTVSQSVQSAVQGHVNAHFDDMGPQSVKNIARPVQAFRVRTAAVGDEPASARRRPGRLAIAGLLAVLLVGALGVWLAGAWAGRPSLLARGAAVTEALVGKLSIAVLPFANVGDDKANEVFADGVTDELIELLSRVQGLQVPPRSSSFHFKGKSVPAVDAARQLGVDHVVDGSVRRAGERVRIGAQLINAADGKVIWSRTFDREFKDVLTAQAEIAIGIAGSLVPSLDPKVGLSGSGTANPEAWKAYLEARRLPPARREAAYARVLEMDPTFARIHTELAEMALNMAAMHTLPLTAAHERMTKHLQEALRIDPRYDHAWGLMGAAMQLVDDVQGLRSVARRAIEANPDSTAGAGWSAALKLLDGDISAAVPMFKHMSDRLPLVDWARLQYAQSLRLANRPALALAVAEQGLALDPENMGALAEKVRSLLALGRRDEALALARERNFNTILIRFGTPEDQAALRLRKDVNAHVAAWQQFLAGRTDAFVEHLAAEHSLIQERALVLFDPEYDPVRGLPSFRDWLGKHNLTEAHERAQAWRAANPVRLN